MLFRSAVNKAGDFTQRKIKSSLPLNDKQDNIHLRNSVKLKKQKVNNKKMYQASLVTVGDKKKVVYALTNEFGRKKTKRYAGKKIIKKTIESNQARIADIIIGVLAKRLGLK